MTLFNAVAGFFAPFCPKCHNSAHHTNAVPVEANVSLPHPRRGKSEFAPDGGEMPLPYSLKRPSPSSSDAPQSRHGAEKRCTHRKARIP